MVQDPWQVVLLKDIIGCFGRIVPGQVGRGGCCGGDGLQDGSSHEDNGDEDKLLAVAHDCYVFFVSYLVDLVV